MIPLVEYAPPAVAAAAITALAVPLLARLARRRGWTDGAEGPLAARKPQGRPVPAVGGVAVLLGALAALLLFGAGAGAGDRGPFLLPVSGAAGAAALGSLLALAAVGFLDDRRPGGLPPGRKLAAQAAALLPAVLAMGGERGAGAAVLLFLGGLVAVNAVNTFDNADGAVGAVCLLGFAAVVPAVAGALAGFLPWNLNAREGRPRDPSATPTAYLGDAGSHPLAFLVLLTPLAWPLLWLPLLDLARLSVVRWRAGSRPWIGDRRHLAHRLAARGLSRVEVVVVLGAIAAPGCGAAAWAAGPGVPLAPWLGAGAAGTLLLFLLACRATRNAVPEGGSGAKHGAPGEHRPS